jgi:hypothetical protein
MTKEKLKEILEAIYSEYRLTEYGKEMLGNAGNGIDDYVNCLGHENLAKHLYKTKILPDLETISEEIHCYSSAVGIIEKFIEMIETLRDQCEFFEMIEQGRVIVVKNCNWPVLGLLDTPDNVINFPQK